MKKLVFIVLPIILLSGCIITSFNPLFKKSDLVVNENLTGRWINKNTLLTFEEPNALSYKLNYKYCEDPYNAPQDYSMCTVADFTTHLMKLGDDTFLDLLPREHLSTENVFLKFHIRATHSFAKVIIEKETLKVYLINYDWVEDYLEENKDALAHIQINDFVTLTASTDELQKFILAHQNKPGFYADAITLKRDKNY